MSLLAKLTRHKPIEQLQQELGERRDFRRVLGVWQLTAIGIGGIIGVGVFVLAGQQAAVNAGPAVAISFLIAGFFPDHRRAGAETEPPAHGSGHGHLRLDGHSAFAGHGLPR